MVVTEALARGIPVLADRVGGLPGRARPRPGRQRARPAGRRPGRSRAGRRAAALAHRRRPARPAAPVGPGRRDDADRLGRSPPGSSPTSWPRRDRASPTGSRCGNRPTRPPARPTSPTGSRCARRRWCTTSAAAPARWPAGWRPGCPARSTGSCTTATPTCWPGPPGPAARGDRRDPAWRPHPADRGRPGRRVLVTASALLDMLTAAEVERVVAACAGRPTLLTLSVTGRVQLDPADPLDAALAAAFDAHQRRTVGGRTLARTGRRRRRGGGVPAPRDRRRGPGHAVAAGPGARSTRAWFAAGSTRPASSGRSWPARPRRSPRPAGAAAAGRLSVSVGHQDLLRRRTD